MDKDIPKWTKHSSKIAHENKWFKVRVDDVTRPNGKRSDYNVIMTPPASFIVPVDDDGQIYLIGQLRYTVGEYSIEIPAGSTDGEDPLDAAKRELREETGLVAKNWQKLGEFYSANGLLNEKDHVYMATGLTQTGHNEQETEGINKLIKLPLDKVMKMIEKGDIKDGQTISSILLYLSKKGFVKV